MKLLLIELVLAWIVLMPLLALGCGAFMRVGRGPGLSQRTCSAQGDAPRTSTLATSTLATSTLVA